MPGSFTGPLNQQILAAVSAPGTPAGPTGLGGVPPSAAGNGWEIFVRSKADYATLLCQVPNKMWTQFQFAKMMDDIGSGTVILNMDDPFWKTAVMGDGSTAFSILDGECLWQFALNGVVRFEFFGETITESLVDASEQRLVTVTGPGTATVLKWAMAAPQGFPNIVNKVDGLRDSFDEIDGSGNGVIDTNIWTTISPAGSVLLTPVAGTSYPGGSKYALSTLSLTGTMTLKATSGGTVLGSTPWDATDSLVSVQISPVGAQGNAANANGTPVAYGTGLDGSEVTQVYLQSLKNGAYYALFGLAAKDFYCELGGPSGVFHTTIPGGYDAATSAFWMITEQGGSGGGSGTFYFWTSADGATWKQRWSVRHNWDATLCGFYVAAKYDAAGQTAVIQSLNSNVTAPSTAGSIFLNQSLFSVWLSLLQAAQGRGTIPFVSTLLTGARDSFGNAWTDTQSLQVTNGTDLLSLLQAFANVTNSNFVMQPGFNLQVGQQLRTAIGLGTDRSQQIIFREARDELVKQRTRTRNTLANLVGAANQDGKQISVKSTSSITQWGQREAWIQTAAQVDPVSMAIAAAAAVADTANEVLSWTLTILPNVPGKTVFESFDVGDWVGLERPDFSAIDAVRVTGIAVQVDQSGVESNELTLVSYIQWLDQQLTYLNNKLGGAFVNVPGTTAIAADVYGIGQVPTFFTPAAQLGSLADVIGTGSAANGAPLVYNAATGQWQPATSVNPATGNPLGVTIPGPTGTVILGSGGIIVSGQPAGGPADGGLISTSVPTITTTPTGQTIVDPNGTTRLTVGVQGDGTITITEQNAPAPATPSTPTTVGGVLSIAVGWDGLLGGANPLSDFLATEVHVSTSTGFTPSSATLKGTLARGGGILTVGGLTTGTTYFAKLVARNKAQVASSASAQASAVPVQAGGPKVSIGAVAPTLPATGDLWFDSTNGYQLRQWNGSIWAVFQFGTNSIAAGTITAAQIVANTITAAQIAAGTITATQIAGTTITAAQIAAGTITAAQIAANTITATKLAAGIVVAGIVDATTIMGAQFVADGSSGEVLVYSGTPAASNLIATISALAGSDSFGNNYPAGMTVAENTFGTSTNMHGSAIDFLNPVATPVQMHLDTSGLYLYSTPGGQAGTLIVALAKAAGSDAYGNSYPQGLFSQQVTLANQASSPTAVTGASSFYSSLVGRPKYLSASGSDSVLERSTVNSAQWTVGNTATPTIISAPLAYFAAEGAQSSEYELEISGNGVGANAATFQSLTFYLYVDGGAYGAGFTIGATWWSQALGNGQPNFRYAARFRLTILTTGAFGTALATSDGVMVNSGNFQGTAGVNTLSLAGIDNGVAFDTTASHTFQVYAWWGGTSSGQTLTTYRTKLGRRM